jgi:hypothetical protein
MHMLHTRRKAEIEILSTAKPQERQGQGEVLRQTMTMMMADKTRWISKDWPPLLDYLLDKISGFMNTYRDVDV